MICNQSFHRTSGDRPQTDSQIMKDVVVDYEVGPEYFPVKKEADVLLKNGKTTLKGSMNEPGFLRCKVIAKVDGRNYEGMATVAVDEERIRPTTADPKDFDNRMPGCYILLVAYLPESHEFRSLM